MADDALIRRKILAAQRGEAEPKLAQMAEEVGGVQSTSARMARLARALVEARNDGVDLGNSDSLRRVYQGLGLTDRDYQELADEPDWWSVLANAAVSTSPGQYLEAFMKMASQAAAGDNPARTAFFKQMERVVDRGMGEEERHLASLDDAGLRREAVQVLATITERVTEMSEQAKSKRDSAEASIEGSLTETLEAREKTGEMPADILGMEG